MIDAAIIGLGRWGKGIVQSVQGRSKRLRFIRGVTKEPDQVRDFAATHGFELSTGFADAVADPRVQAVVLATPHSLHVDQIAAVAAAGKPVWCEKPLALTLAEAKRAIAAVEEAGVVFALGNNKRCFPSMQELRRVVAAGQIGEVLHIEAHFCNEHSTRVVPGGWRDDPAESPGGGLTGAGLHLIDALVSLGGPIAEVYARLFERKPPPDPRDVIALQVQFANGGTGQLASVRAAPAYWRVHVFGTKGWAEARDETTLTVAPNGRTPQTQTLAPADSLGVLLEAFGEAIELGTPFPVTTDEMLAVVAAFEAAIESLRSRQPVAAQRG
ncbi:MAG TPA: Gfo/Idh/MocA family oxidoreductase [Xanthobacteraceae bacterium]|nr:Gfo/Idh/MocA family oxidoreductase [Xanthobacteraceae bacterium]